MRLVAQRVSHASVSVDGKTVGAIERGLAVLVGVAHGDTEEQADWLAGKIAGLRIFEDEAGKMNAGLLDVGGAGFGRARRGVAWWRHVSEKSSPACGSPGMGSSRAECGGQSSLLR